jgi:hypothetical protein
LTYLFATISLSGLSFMKTTMMPETILARSAAVQYKTGMSLSSAVRTLLDAPWEYQRHPSSVNVTGQLHNFLPLISPLVPEYVSYNFWYR